MVDKVRVPKGLREWRANAYNLTVEEVISNYEIGLAGAYYDEVSHAELTACEQYPDGQAAAELFGLVGDGKDKLCLPYLAAWKHWPKCWPCPGQTTGDCVSHAGKNCGLILIGVEAESGEPDPVTSIIEGFPEVTAEAEEQGVVACENIYRARGHSGQGASCSTLIKYVTTRGGIMLRKPYPELNIDLTRYNASLGIPGGQGVPEAWSVEGAKHQIRISTECQSHEVARDLIANGFPIWACSGYGWSNTRDENGYSPQRGSWAHSWVIMGTDYRPATIQKYGFPLALYNHDWARWNSGGRDILNSADIVPSELKADWAARGIVNATTGALMIPEGSMWIDARLLDRCDIWAVSNLNGFPRRKPNLSWL